MIRVNREAVAHAAEAKRIDVDLEALLSLDDRRRALQAEVEAGRAERNRISEAVAAAVREGRGEEAGRLKAAVRSSAEAHAALEAELAETVRRLAAMLDTVPNVVSPDTPAGLSDADNVEVRRRGEPPAFAFEPLDHMALGERLGIIDAPRGVKTAGSRHYYLKGDGVLLHRAVQQLAIDLLLARGFDMLEVPVIVRTAAMRDAGYFPLGEEQAYRIAEEDGWLVGTSEVPLAGYYAGEIVDVSAPIRLAAASNCFRREVGSAGRDVYGLYRVHQFAKVEQVVLCRADLAVGEAMLQELTYNAEELLRLLELPYRVMAVCAGDLSQKNYKQYDLECWMPSRASYGETHSSSLLLDFQARRANIRYRDEAGRLRYCYTLNNTAVASPRILIPLLEIHQQEDGTVRIPPALRPYMQGRERIGTP